LKELSLDEISLLEEIKSNCLKKGQYIDDKAKDKFKMLCHLEDFSIAYYELLDVIKEVREWLIEKKETIERFEIYKRKETGAFWYTTLGEIEKYLEILDKENNNER